MTPNKCLKWLIIIAIIEVLGHSFLRWYANDWTYPQLIHLTMWSIWLIILIIIKLRRSN